MTCGSGAALRKALVAVSKASMRPLWHALKDCVMRNRARQPRGGGEGMSGVCVCMCARKHVLGGGGQVCACVCACAWVQ